MRLPMLRSSELAPIDLLDRELQDETGSDLFNLVVISPCQTFVSNDPTAEESIERTPCNITSFECYDNIVDMPSANGGASSPSAPSRVTVDFDYELWYTNPDEFNQTLVQLESSMLQHLAKVFNLEDCPYVSASNTNVATVRSHSGGRQRHLQIFGDELADLFVGVDSTPVDKPDEDLDECIVPVMESDKVSAACQPMKGSFSAAVNADVSQDSLAEASIKSGLLRLLRLGMNENLYVLDDVRKVSFIGDRTAYVPPSTPTVQSNGSPSESGGIGTAGLTVTILAALLVFLIGGFLVGRHVRNKKQEQHDKGVALDESYALDEEVASPSYNKGFMGAAEGEQNAAEVQGSLASTDELALQPQPIVVPVLSKSSAGSDVAEDSTSKVTGEDTMAATPVEAPAGESNKQDSTAADELAAVLLAATAANASAEKAGEEATGEKISGDEAKPKTPPKKKKRKKKGKRSPDSPDSLLAESLRKLDSIAEEGETSVIDESGDNDTGSGRSLT